MPPRKLDAYMRKWAGSLRAVDDLVAAAIAALGRRGRPWNLIFVSNNGYLLGQHRRNGKVVPYEESMRTTMRAAGPDFPTGVHDSLVASVDAPATTTAIADTRLAKTNGIDLWPVNLRRQALLPEHFGEPHSDGANLIGNPNPIPSWTAARSEAAVYIEPRQNSGVFREFYDLRADPYQLRNLVGGDPRAAAYQDVLEQLRNCQGDACNAAVLKDRGGQSCRSPKRGEIMRHRTRVWSVILAIIVVLGAMLPWAGSAQDANAITAHGCTITPRKPGNIDGLIQARADAECARSLPGREIVVELWQKDNDGDWKIVPPGQTDWVGADKAFDTSEYDGVEISCRDLDQGRTRKYRSLIKVSDGNGTFRQALSNVEDLGRDCLVGQDDTEISAAADESADEIAIQRGPDEGVRAVLFACENLLYPPTSGNGYWSGVVNTSCTLNYVRRKITAEFCESRQQRRDPCGFGKADYMNSPGSRIFRPRCIIWTASPPSWITGTYTRVSFKVKTQAGNNLKDRASSWIRPEEKSCFVTGG